MVIKRVWLEVGKHGQEWKRAGWYLFGIVPLYIRDEGPRHRIGAMQGSNDNRGAR